MKLNLNNIIRKFPKSQSLFKICKAYIDYFNGENNSDIQINGELNFLKKILGSCNVVFDIGANTGQWTKLALMINKNLNIHCFEPSKFTFKKLIKNKFPSNVVCNNIGLGSAKDMKTLYVLEDGSEFNSLYQKRGAKGEKIQLETLEDYCKERNIEHIDLIKIDVEGHELEVLRGGKSLLQNGKIKIIQFEYGFTFIYSHTFLKDIFDFFEEINYKLYKMYPNYIRFIKKYHLVLETFQYQNWLAIRKDIVLPVKIKE